MDNFLRFCGSGDSSRSSVCSYAGKHKGWASLTIDGLDPNELKRLSSGEFAAKVKIDVDGSTLRFHVDWGNVRQAGRKPKLDRFDLMYEDDAQDPDFILTRHVALARIYEIGVPVVARCRHVSQSTVYRLIQKLKEEMDERGESYDDIVEAHAESLKNVKK